MSLYSLRVAEDRISRLIYLCATLDVSDKIIHEPILFFLRQSARQRKASQFLGDLYSCFIDHKIVEFILD